MTPLNLKHITAHKQNDLEVIHSANREERFGYHNRQLEREFSYKINVACQTDEFNVVDGKRLI